MPRAVEASSRLQHALHCPTEPLLVTGDGVPCEAMACEMQEGSSGNMSRTDGHHARMSSKYRIKRYFGAL